MIQRVFLISFVVQLITYLTTILGMTVDGIVTGSFLGPDCLAAYGLITPLLTVLTAISSAISTGTSTIVGLHLGKGDINEMNRVFRICFWTTLIISFIVTITLFVFADPIAYALGARGEIKRMVADYIRGYCFGFPAIYIVVLSTPIFQLIGKGSTLVKGILIMTAINISMDFFNVLVWHREMYGMAIATTVSYTVTLIIVLRVLLSNSSMIYVLPVRLDAGVVKEMVFYGLPKGVSMGCKNILTIVINHLIISITAISMVAANASISSSIALALSISIGLASTVSMLTGVIAGEKDRQDLVELMKLSIKYSIIMNGICIIVYTIFAKPIASLFLRGNPQILSDAALGLRIVVLNLVLYSINFCIRSYYQAMKIPLAMPHAVINSLLCPMILAYIFGHTIGIVGVWIAYPLAEVVTIIFFGVIALGKSKADGKRSFLERIMLIPDEFYDDVEPLEMIVQSEEEAIKASESVKAYMEKNGSSQRISLFASLAVEELTINTIRHGFSKKTNNKHSNTIMLKLKKSNDEWILRLRDDCIHFDPVAYIKEITPEEKESHFGIRMIYAIADDIKYLKSFNLNNLLIRFKIS